MSYATSAYLQTPYSASKGGIVSPYPAGTEFVETSDTVGLTYGTDTEQAGEGSTGTQMTASLFFSTDAEMLVSGIGVVISDPSTWVPETSIEVVWVPESSIEGEDHE